MTTVSRRDIQHVVASRVHSGDKHRAAFLSNDEMCRSMIGDGHGISNGSIDASVQIVCVDGRYLKSRFQIVSADREVVLTEGEHRSVVVDVTDGDKQLGHRSTDWFTLETTRMP